MKSLKAAAIVAGSLVVAGLATPAVAADAAGVRPANLNGTVGELTQDVKAPGLDGQKMLDTKTGLVPKAVEKTTGTVGNGQMVR
ncbi:hypothetical protein [Streptomyces sp. NBC_00286]|uniref:hypothetical protein n=1 Tax=Streptomyces sp. NBC_00286 TaxID=2975701 RepID=UPI002E2DB439|nr:hypothetical protein [Streptomyces sp. NBC_00286]